MVREACSECTDSTTQCSGSDFAASRKGERGELDESKCIYIYYLLS